MKEGIIACIERVQAILGNKIERALANIKRILSNKKDESVLANIDDNKERVLANEEMVLPNEEEERVLSNEEKVLFNEERVRANIEKVLLNEEEERVLVNEERVLSNEERVLVNEERVLANRKEVRVLSNEEEWATQLDIQRYSLSESTIEAANEDLTHVGDLSPGPTASEHDDQEGGLLPMMVDTRYYELARQFNR